MKTGMLSATVIALLALSACSSTLSHTNIRAAGEAPAQNRATLDVTPARGKGDTLMILALSGGGSRAAYWGTSAMFRLQQVFADQGIDLLAEVDALSSVSGGSLPAAYYAISTDPGGERKYGRVWEEQEVKALMKRNYIMRWFGNWFWPNNILGFWFTAYDRTDIMAQTFADSLFDVRPGGRDLKMRDLREERPYLVLNATNGTDGEERFGKSFTFTANDFAAIDSDIGDYELARAVMGTATFPAVFNYMTLKNFRGSVGEDHYVHLFDGGNVDNLGLEGVNRILQRVEDNGTSYDKLVVILIDAYAGGGGIAEEDADARRPLDFIVDTNFLDATDSLLSANRLKRVEAFENYLEQRYAEDPALRARSVFYHLKFADVSDDKLLGRLNSIKTNFKISNAEAQCIDAAAKRLLTRNNDCLLAIRDLLTQGSHNGEAICSYRN